MTRRTFAAAVAAFFAVPLSLITERRAYGLMTVDRWHRLGMREAGAQVLLDGRNVTSDCFAFNDREGWVDVFERNADGRHYLNANRTGAASARLRGRVAVVFVFEHGEKGTRL